MTRSLLRRRPAAAALLSTALVTLLGAGVLVGCSSTASTAPSAAPTGPTSTAPSGPSPTATASAPATTARAGDPAVVADGLAAPWGVAFLPSGDALVTERDSHRLLRVTPAGTVTELGTVPGVGGGGEGGLLGLAVSPDFATDRTAFAYLTTDDDNRVVRFTLEGDTAGGFTPVLTGIPAAGIHNGGRIAFGPDGLLYVTTGDAGQRERAPDTDFLGGKVLRMTTDGSPAPGNPDPASVVWTRGHRNPQGLAFGPDGTVYAAEFGQNSLDEVNRLTGGADYGWPAAEGTEGDTAGTTAPLLTFPTTAASPSGMVYAGGSLWLAALGGERLYRMTLAADGTLAAPETLFADRYGRLRTVVLAPDGALWLTTSNRDGRGDPAADDDRILRVPLV